MTPALAEPDPLIRAPPLPLPLPLSLPSPSPHLTSPHLPSVLCPPCRPRQPAYKLYCIQPVLCAVTWLDGGRGNQKCLGQISPCVAWKLHISKCLNLYGVGGLSSACWYGCGEDTWSSTPLSGRTTDRCHDCETGKTAEEAGRERQSGTHRHQMNVTMYLLYSYLLTCQTPECIFTECLHAN